MSPSKEQETKETAAVTPEETTAEKAAAPAAAKRPGTKWIGTAAAILIAVIILAISAWLLFGGRKDFNSAYEEAKDRAYGTAYEKSFAAAEEKNRVSNDVALTIGNIREENELEVLRVSDTWVKMTTEEEEKETRTKRWVEYTASGVYVVDMSTSEFIIDNEQDFVIVRLSSPRLTHIALDEHPTILNYDYRKGFLKINGNYDEGVNLALEDREEALAKITQQLESNNANFEKAKQSAQTLVREFLRSVNPGIDLQDDDIQIEFI